MLPITRLRKERLDRGWTLEYVGKQVGVTKSSILRIETLQNKPSYDVLVKLQELFGLYRCDLLALVDSDENSFSSTY